MTIVGGIIGWFVGGYVVSKLDPDAGGLHLAAALAGAVAGVIVMRKLR